jgi:predicted CXXCH cytochrome family protein
MSRKGWLRALLLLPALALGVAAVLFLPSLTTGAEPGSNDVSNAPASQPPAGDAAPTPTPARVASDAQEKNAFCLSCHSNPDFAMMFPNGDVLPLYVDPEDFQASVHGTWGLACVNCHAAQEQVPHPPNEFEDRRSFTVEFSEKCRLCHQEASKTYDESVHGVTALLGVPRAATCTDCHTAHYVKQPFEWTNAERATRCSQCHKGADANFASGWLGHREPSFKWFPLTFYTERFLIFLTASVLGFGIVHVELELLRWFLDRRRGGRR